MPAPLKCFGEVHGGQFRFERTHVGRVRAVPRLSGRDPRLAGPSQFPIGAQPYQDRVDVVVVTGLGFGQTGGQQPDLRFVQQPRPRRCGTMGHVFKVAGLSQHPAGLAPRLPGMAPHPRRRAGEAIFRPPAATFPRPGQTPHPCLGEILHALSKAQRVGAVLTRLNGNHLSLQPHQHIRTRDTCTRECFTTVRRHGTIIAVSEQVFKPSRLFPCLLSGPRWLVPNRVSRR